MLSFLNYTAFSSYRFVELEFTARGNPVEVSIGITEYRINYIRWRHSDTNSDWQDVLGLLRASSQSQRKGPGCIPATQKDNAARLLLFKLS